MEIKTKRLILFPLTANHLQLLISDLVEFEKQTSCHYNGEELIGEIYSIFKGQIAPVQVSGADFVWRTFWMIVLKEDNTIIGSVCYKDIPTTNGSVEIGYGVNPKYEGKGYMTETVGAMIQWALQQPNVLEVIAEVDKANIASHRVLQKNGFQIFKSIGSFDWYRISNVNTCL